MIFDWRLFVVCKKSGFGLGHAGLSAGLPAFILHPLFLFKTFEAAFHIIGREVMASVSASFSFFGGNLHFCGTG